MSQTPSEPVSSDPLRRADDTSTTRSPAPTGSGDPGSVPFGTHVPYGTHVPAEPVRERTGLGLLAALAVVVLGVVLAVIIWRMGLIAALAGFVMAAGAVTAYQKAAGSAPRRGLPAVAVLILLGVFAAMLACIGSDLWDAYTTYAPADAAMSRGEFIRGHLFDGEVWSSEATNLVMLGAFAALGAFRTFARLMQSAGRTQSV